MARSSFTARWPTWAFKAYHYCVKVVVPLFSVLYTVSSLVAFTVSIYCLVCDRLIHWSPLLVCVIVFGTEAFVIAFLVLPCQSIQIDSKNFCAFCRKADRNRVRTISHTGALYLPSAELAEICRTHQFRRQGFLRLVVPIRHHTTITSKLSPAQRRRRHRKYQVTEQPLYTLCNLTVRFVVRPHQLTQQGLDFLIADRAFYEAHSGSSPATPDASTSPQHQALADQLSHQIADHLVAHPDVSTDVHRSSSPASAYRTMAFDLSSLKLDASAYGFYKVCVISQQYLTRTDSNIPRGHQWLDIGRYFSEVRCD